MRIQSALGTVSSRKIRQATAALAFATIAASVGSGVSAWADTYGSNGGTTLNLPSSWVDETNPANTGVLIPGATDIAAFDSNAALTTATTFSLGAPTSWLGIFIQNPGAAVTIGTAANPLTLGASGIDMSAATANLTLAPSALTLAAAQTWNVATGQTLTVSSTVDNGGNLLTVQGGGTTVISNSISDSGGLLLAGPGIVTLSGANSYSGPTTLNAGTLNINNASALGSGTFTIAGGTINNSTAAAITLANNNAQNINGSFAFTGTQALNLGAGSVTLGANTVITVTASTLTEGGNITDNGSGFGITKAGAGALTLAGSNNYAGPTTLNAGTLNLNNAAALGTGNLVIAGGTINNNSAGAITLNNNTENWNASFAFTGTQQLNLGSGGIVLGVTPTVTVNGNATNGVLTAGGVISDGGLGLGIVKAGTGTLVLAGANTFTGPVTINAGIVNINSLAALGAGTVLNFGGGTLQLAGGIDISTDTVNFTGNATIDTAGNSVTFVNSIGNGGAGGLTKAGAGVLTLAPTDNYTGNTSVTAGTLVFSGLASLGSGSAITIANGTLQYAPGFTDDITSRAVSATAALATIDINGNSVSYAHPISGSSTLSIASTAGPATLTINTPGFYAGNTAINSGVTVVLGNASAFQNSVLTLNSGSTLNFGTATAVSFGGLSGAQNIVLQNASGGGVALTLGANGGNYTGVISDGGLNLSLTKIGAGTQLLNNANTYNGDTVVNGGELELNFTAPSTQTSDILYQQVTAGTTAQGSEGRLILGGGTLFVTNRTNTTTFQQFASTVVNAGASEVSMLGRTSGSKPEVFLYNITRNVGATVDFTPSSGNASGEFTTNANNASGMVGGWATQNGGNDWAHIAGTTGPTTNGLPTGVTIGVSSVTYSNAFTSNTVNTDMTASLVAPANNTTGSIRFNTAAAGITLTTTGNNVDASGGILVTSTVAANTPSIVPANSSSTLTSGNGTDLIVIDNDTSSGSSFTIQTPIVDNATPIALTKSGAGTLILTGNNTFTGGLYLNAGTVQVGNAGALNSSTPNSVFFGNSSANASGTLTLLGNSITVPQISTANVAVGTPIIQNANATSAVLTVSGALPSTFNGTIVNGTGAGTLALTVSGSGGLTLSGANSYTGNTTILSGSKLALSSASNNISGSKIININAGGTLSVTNVTGGFSIASGQTLTGSGTILGTVNVPSNTVVSPGTAGVGTLTTSGLTLNANSILNLEFNGSTNDLINVLNAGGLVINGTPGSVNINVLQANTSTPFTTTGTYDILQYVGSIGGAGLSALTDANVPIGTAATFGTATVGGIQYVTLTLAPGGVTLPTWNLAGGGSWNVGGNWNPTGVPSAQGQTAVFGSSITTPSTVTLDGNETVGTLAFNNTNSYTIAQGSGGSLILDNGTTAAHITGNLGSHIISAPVTLNSNLSASITSGSVTISGIVSEGTPGKTITMNGAGTLALSNANTYTGGTILGSGTVQVGNNLALGSGPVTFSATATLQAGTTVSLSNPLSLATATVGTIDTQANTMTLSGIISSADATSTFNKIGSGTLIITGTNTFTGAVTVNGGTLQIGDGVTNGSFAAATITTVNSTLAYNTTGALTIANNITGNGQLAQIGNNTLTLSGANTFSGGMLITNGGTVTLTGNNNLDTAAGTGTITLNNGTLISNGFTGSTTPTYGPLANTIFVPAGATGILYNPSRGDFTGSLTGSGTFYLGGVYVRGDLAGDWSAFTGHVYLGNNNATLGNTTVAVTSGDYRVTNTNFNVSNAMVTINTGGFMYLTAAGTISLGDLTGNGTIGPNGNGTLSLVIGNAEVAGQTTTFTGTIANSGGVTSVTKTGAGILNLAGINSFTGGITVANGTLEFLGASQFPTSVTTVTLGSATTSGILDLAGFGSINVTGLATPAGSPAGNIIGSSSTSLTTSINFATGTTTFAGTIQDGINGGNQPLTLNVFSGNLTLSGTNTYSGGTSIIGGKLQLGAGGTTGSIVATPATTIIDNGVLAFNRSDNVAFPAIISGSGGITQAGPGVLTLTNPANAYSGNITITGGTLQMVTGVPFGTGSNALVVTAGTLDLNGSNLTIGSLSGAAAGVIDNVSAGGSVLINTGSLGANVTFAGAIKNTSGSVGITKVGGGTLTLSGANTFGGPIDIQAGKIQLAGAGTLGSSAPLTVEAGAVLDLNGVSASIGSLNGAGTVDNVASAGASVLTTGSLNANATFSGIIQNTAGSVGLVKNGTGSLTLTGANTYTGNTIVNSGGLYVNNTSGSGLGTGAVTLNGGILGGNGAITSPVSAGTGPHTINPGATAGSVGTLTIGGLTTNTNTTLAFDLASPASPSDLLAVAGNIDISAGATVAIASQSVTGSASLGYYKAVSYTGTLTGSASTVVLPAATNNIVYTLDTIQDAGFIDIHRGFIGDANDDGKVDLTDLNVVLNNLGTTNSSWGKGNFDGAATIDLTDLNDVLNHLGTSIASGSAVVATVAAPEPASLGILAFGAAALIARRRKAFPVN